jgi:hypothetical protein
VKKIYAAVSKRDIAGLPGVEPDYAQTIIDAPPFTAKEDLLAKEVIAESAHGEIQDPVTAEGTEKQSLLE